MFYLLGGILFFVIVFGGMWLIGRFTNFIIYGSSSPDKASIHHDPI
jgi:hypothetical protein